MVEKTKTAIIYENFILVFIIIDFSKNIFLLEILMNSNKKN